MITLAVALIAVAGQQSPLPPYKRIETIPVSDPSYAPSLIVKDSVFYTFVNNMCQAFDLKIGKPLWKISLGEKESGRNITFEGGLLFLATDGHGDAKSRLVALDAKNGDVKWSLPRSGETSPIAAGGGTLYLTMSPSSISAVDQATRKVKWTRTFPEVDQNFGTEVKAVELIGKHVLANSSAVTYCLDVATGKVVWTEPSSFLLFTSYVWFQNTVWLPSGEGSVAREVASGKVLWRKSDIGYFEFGDVFGNNFVGLDDGKIAALKPTTGEVAWSFQVGEPDWGGGHQFGSVVGSRLFVRGMKKSAIFDTSGKVLWEGKDVESLPMPIWTDGNSIIGFDGQRLLRYEHGVAEELPVGEARAVLAAQLVAKFDQLDDADQRRLFELGDAAFEPLLKEYLATCASYDAKAGTGTDTYPLYSRFHDIGNLLEQVTTASRGTDLLKVFAENRAPNSAQPLLLTLLAKHGKPEDVTPYFLRALEGVATPGFEMYESVTYVARGYISNSTDPRAVAFMLKQLRDPKADEVLRYEAYVRLAGTGGEEGVKAVLAERKSRQLLRPVADRALANYSAQGARAKPVSEKTSADKKVWGLLHIGVLGGGSDLWLAERVNGNWTNPWFLGVSSEGVSSWVEPPVKEPTILGETGATLEKSNWLELLQRDKTYTKDGDSDGLTDLAEWRLGTDAGKSDTDGDGDHDGVDPWPNAPGRPISDAERVLAAVFEAKYHQADNEWPAVFFAPKGMKPFEMVGWAGPVIWLEGSRARWSHPLEWCYQQGVAFIRFSEFTEGESKPWEERVIKWNNDRTEATVGISTYYGGLNGSGYKAVVRKFGSEWIVVRMDLEYVS